MRLKRHGNWFFSLDNGKLGRKNSSEFGKLLIRQTKVLFVIITLTVESINL